MATAALLGGTMNDTQIEKIKFFKKERDRLNARSRALSMSKVNCVRIVLGSLTEGKYDYEEAFFDDEPTVSLIKEFLNLLQENDEINFEKLRAKLKHIKIKF